MQALNSFYFIGLPYIALFVMIFGTIYRYRTAGFRVSSLSSEFLESKKLFWGSVPFHWGMMFLFFGHLAAFLVPKGVMAWNAHPVRLLVIEISAFVFALCMFVGLFNLILRRMSDDRVRVVSSWMDYSILLLLMLQVVTGLATAYFFRWGSSWFAAVLTPYLRSLLVFSPDIVAISSMHWVIQLHVIGAFLIILMIPFSRLMHFLVVPLPYLWRPFQRVIWYWNRRAVRSPKTQWTTNEPMNN